VKAAYERSDVCVVPAAGVAAEAMVALTLATCALDKFGGDSMDETLRNFEGYLNQLKNY
jgi:chorismate synthase